MADDPIKIIDSKNPSPQELFDAAKEGKIDVYLWAEEGFGPNSEVINKPDHYKICFHGSTPIRNQFFKELYTRGHTVPPLFLVNDPVKKEDLFVHPDDIAKFRDSQQKPPKLLAALAAQRKFPRRKKENKSDIMKWLEKNYTIPKTPREIIATMVRQGEVDIADQVWKELYFDEQNQHPQKGHIVFIKDHLQKHHGIKKSNKADRIAEIINPNPLGGAPKTGNS